MSAEKTVRYYNAILTPGAAVGGDSSRYGLGREKESSKRSSQVISIWRSHTEESRLRLGLIVCARVMQHRTMLLLVQGQWAKEIERDCPTGVSPGRRPASP